MTSSILGVASPPSWLRWHPLRAPAWAIAGLFLVSIVSTLPALAAVAEAGAPGDKIVWAMHGAPPLVITEGPDADTGIYDVLRRTIAARLDGYSHVTLTGTLPRIVDMIKQGRNWCFIGATKSPERQDFAYFSLPVGFSGPLSIVVHTPQLARFEALGPLSLETLLLDRHWRTSLLQGRVTTPEIDALFRLHPPEHVHSEVAEAYAMLLADRLDYLVAYPQVAAYSARLLGRPGELVGLPFKEAPVPNIDHIMCPKTEWGRRLIDRIDAILRVQRATPAYRALLERWSDQASVEKIRSLYDSFFMRAE